MACSVHVPIEQARPADELEKRRRQAEARRSGPDAQYAYFASSDPIGFSGFAASHSNWEFGPVACVPA